LLAQLSLSTAASLTDAEVVDRVRAGESAWFEVLMRRHNQRVYRVARSVLRDEREVDEVMQQAYFNAYTHLAAFEGRSSFATWLTRIAVHEALRLRRRAGQRGEIPFEEEGSDVDAVTSQALDPEAQAYSGELRRLLESAIDALPDRYRIVFMLRDVEGLSTAEVAETLDVGEEGVKTRLHRARAMLRRDLMARAGATTSEAFAFHLSRCDALVEKVFAAIENRTKEKR
jgi:RNA polymerase sigma-70 factor (ECF subfamily)